MRGVAVRVEVVDGNAVACPGDVLVLKYAQDRYGLDGQVAGLLRAAGIADEHIRPEPGSLAWAPTAPEIAADAVLFIGVEPLFRFDYPQIQAFARRALEAMAERTPDARRLVVTIHGPGYGLDEAEALRSQIAGFLDAIEAGSCPPMLQRITFVELSRKRVERLRATLDRTLPGGILAVERPDRRSLRSIESPMADPAFGFGQPSSPPAPRQHIFVAMPFADDFEDIFYYGIHQPVNRTGLLCERADLSHFSGDVIGWVRDRIRTAPLVIADLTGANPNVFLEVGFAWGCNVPTVLLCQDTDALPFDVRGQRCLAYRSIRDLESKLDDELKGLGFMGHASA